MPWYRAGSVAVTNGSATVTGANTDFVANTQAGEVFLGPDGRVYEISGVQSATQLTIIPNYQGASAGGQGYGIQPTSSFARDLALGVSQLLNTFGGVRDGIGQGLIPDGTLGTPALRFAADQDTGIRRAGANSLSLVTGGVDRLYAGENGRVGIGSANPGAQLDVSGTTPALLRLFNSAGAGGIIDMLDSQWQAQIEHNGGNLLFRTGGNVERVRISTDGVLRPGIDNAQSLGIASLRWSVVYAGTGSIATSDLRQKNDIGPITDEWLDAWGDVQWCRFRFRDAVEEKGDEARWHVGLIAQQVRDAFAARDLDAQEIGLLCHDAWEASPAVPEVRDEDGAVITPAVKAVPAGDRWGLRYDECQAMEAAWQRRRIEQLEAQLAALDARMSAS